MNSVPEAWLTDELGRVLVIDLDGPWIAIGTLAGIGRDHLVLTQADLHDLREGTSTREVYALESKTLGVRVNRARVQLPLAQVAAVSRLEDVVS